MTLGAAVCHTVSPFAQTALLVNVHCNESLVWFKASGFCYTISAGPSLKLFLNNKVIEEKGGIINLIMEAVT